MSFFFFNFYFWLNVASYKAFEIFSWELLGAYLKFCYSNMFLQFLFFIFLFSFFTRSIVRCHAVTIPREVNYKQVLFGDDGLNANAFWLYNVLIVVERIIFLYFELRQVLFHMNVFSIRNFQKELWYFILGFPILWSSFCILNCDRVYFIVVFWIRNSQKELWQFIFWFISNSMW